MCDDGVEARVYGDELEDGGDVDTVVLEHDAGQLLSERRRRGPVTAPKGDFRSEEFRKQRR